MTRDEMRSLFLLGAEAHDAHDASVRNVIEKTRSAPAAHAPRDGAVSAWRERSTYAAGDIVVHRGVRYKARSSHGGFEPGGAPSVRGEVWERVAPSNDDVLRRIVKSAPTALEEPPTFDAVAQIAIWTGKLHELEREQRACADPELLQVVVKQVRAAERHLARLRVLADRP